MKLTNFRKAMVEKYYSFDPPISKEEFCKNHCRMKIDPIDFGIWVSLYEDSKSVSIASYNKSTRKKKKKSTSRREKTLLKPNCDIAKVNKERTRLAQLRQIRYFKGVVKTGKFSFSQDPRKQKSRIKMFLEKDNCFRIYKLALILAEDLNDAECKIALLLKELKKHHVDIPDSFFDFQFTNKNSKPIESYVDEETKDTTSVVFEIDPTKNNKFALHNHFEEKEELNFLCEKSISNLKSTLAGVYKILEGLQS